jgi:hypothetical protein
MENSGGSDETTIAPDSDAGGTPVGWGRNVPSRPSSAAARTPYTARSRARLASSATARGACDAGLLWSRAPPARLEGSQPAIYDADGDVLYVHLGPPQEGEKTPEGHVLRYVPGTQRIVGLTVINARYVLERDGRLIVTVPETVEASAEELAPALQAA